MTATTRITTPSRRAWKRRTGATTVATAGSRGSGGGARERDPSPKNRREAGKLSLARVKRNYDDEDDELDSDGESGDDDELDPVWDGGDGFGDNDYSDLVLKPDHANRPLWICSDGRIFLESFSPVYKAAYDFLISVAEPVCRPANMHEYVLTPHSLYAAVSVGLETSTILSVLGRLSKTQLSREIHEFVEACTANYGKVKLVLQRNRFFLESPDPRILRELLADDVVRRARVLPPQAAGALPGAGGEFTVTQALRDKAAAAVTLAAIDEGAEEKEGVDGSEPTEGIETAEKPSTFDATLVPEYDPHREMSSFEIDAEQVEHVKQRCLPGNLGYPTLEEYDFRNDTRNPDLDIALKPMTRIRPYQEKSLSKMFGNGRAALPGSSCCPAERENLSLESPPRAACASRCSVCARRQCLSISGPRSSSSGQTSRTRISSASRLRTRKSFLLWGRPASVSPRTTWSAREVSEARRVAVCWNSFEAVSGA